MAAPKHHLKINFQVTERGFTKLAAPELYQFDSESAHIFSLDRYLEGHHGFKEAHIFYSYLSSPTWSDPRHSLRVLWWEYEYPDGTTWIGGAVLNEAIEGALGRFAGHINVGLIKEGEAGEFQAGNCHILDQRGFSFSFGKPKAAPHFQKLTYFLNNSIPAGKIPPEKFYVPVPAPDRIGGDSAWKPDWSPRDRTGDPRYAGDSRNPPLDGQLHGIPVPRWYEAQTHAHYRESFRSIHETGWLAAKKAGNQALEEAVLRDLWEWCQSNYGSFSPSLGPTHFIDGRPLHLSFLDGTLFQAGRRYRLTQVDQAALKPAVLTEGRPQIGKGQYQFTECFGREKLSYPERVSDKFAGQYLGANGRDFEHGGHESLVASALILGDPLAKRQLHHICEEVLSNWIMSHSTRSTCGWNILVLAYGYLVFTGTQWNDDAERYISRFRDVAQWTWDHRMDLTPYQGMLTVTYEKLYLDQPEEGVLGWEASMQCAVALYTFVVGARVDSDAASRGLYQDLCRYLVGVLQQDYIVDWSRGGILARWSLQGPVAEDPTQPKTASERLELSGGAYGFRNVDAAEGWCGGALAAAARLLQDPKIEAFAKEVYDHQKVKITGGQPMLSWNAPTSWAMHYESHVTFYEP